MFLNKNNLIFLEILKNKEDMESLNSLNGSISFKYWKNQYFIIICGYIISKV